MEKIGASSLAQLVRIVMDLDKKNAVGKATEVRATTNARAVLREAAPAAGLKVSA